MQIPTAKHIESHIHLQCKLALLALVNGKLNIDVYPIPMPEAKTESLILLLSEADERKNQKPGIQDWKSNPKIYPYGLNWCYFLY